MGFQPTRQLLILGDLVVIFEYLPDGVRPIFFLENQPIKEKREQNLPIMNQIENIKI